MTFRERVIGVILTGTLDDGAAGLWAIKQCGGLAIVQSDAAFDEMPRSAVENVSVDHHVPLHEIPLLLRRLSQ
jgi:two-component system chemotaxis response regulator CheB